MHRTLSLALIESSSGRRSEKDTVISLILIGNIGCFMAWVVAKVEALLKLVVL